MECEIKHLVLHVEYAFFLVLTGKLYFKFSIISRAINLLQLYWGFGMCYNSVLDHAENSIRVNKNDFFERSNWYCLCLRFYLCQYKMVMLKVDVLYFDMITLV